MVQSGKEGPESEPFIKNVHHPSFFRESLKKFNWDEGDREGGGRGDADQKRRKWNVWTSKGFNNREIKKKCNQWGPRPHQTLDFPLLGVHKGGENSRPQESLKVNGRSIWTTRVGSQPSNRGAS